MCLKRFSHTVLLYVLNSFRKRCGPTLTLNLNVIQGRMAAGIYALVFSWHTIFNQRVLPHLLLVLLLLSPRTFCLELLSQFLLENFLLAPATTIERRHRVHFLELLGLIKHSD